MTDEPLPDIQTEGEFIEFMEDVIDSTIEGYRNSTEVAKDPHTDNIQNAMRLMGIKNRLEDGEITLEEAKEEATDE